MALNNRHSYHAGASSEFNLFNQNSHPRPGLIRLGSFEGQVGFWLSYFPLAAAAAANLNLKFACFLLKTRLKLNVNTWMNGREKARREERTMGRKLWKQKAAVNGGNHRANGNVGGLGRQGCNHHSPWFGFTFHNKFSLYRSFFSSLSLSMHAQWPMQPPSLPPFSRQLHLPSLPFPCPSLFYPLFDIFSSPIYYSHSHFHSVELSSSLSDCPLIWSNLCKCALHTTTTLILLSIRSVYFSVFYR